MRKKRYMISLIFTILMVFVAEFTDELEIIFPEVLALLSGAWIADTQPWKVSKKQLFLLISLSSFVGVIIVKYIYVHTLIKIAIAFTFSFLILTLSKTTIIPLISACILPILLNTSTWVYPISVTIMCALIVIIQYFMEILCIRHKENNTVILSDSVATLELEDNKIKNIIIKYFKSLTIILFVALFPVITNNLFFIAPPLIVTFMEFSDINSPARKNAKKIVVLIGITALVGSMGRLFFNVYLELPLYLVCAIVTICVFIIFEKNNIIFPPAAAISLLPLLLNENSLYIYPIEVFIGSCIFITLALLIFKENEKVYDM